MKLSEIIKYNSELKLKLQGIPEYRVALLSNTIINPIAPVLEYELRTNGINLVCSFGDYDNIVQDSNVFSSSDLVVVFWELANMVDGFQYKSNLLTDDEVKEYLTRFKSEIDYVFHNLERTPIVLFNTFSTIVFNHTNISKNNFDYICIELNKYIEEKRSSNVVLVDINNVYAKVGIDESVDFRNYYSSKSLYTISFYKRYVQYVKHIIFSVLGKSKKAIVFDCDNTLWSGILGEDGFDGIEMNSSTYKGVVFEEVQYLAKKLAKEGIIIGLNSKNNDVEVDQVINSHNSFRLSNDDIIIKKVNWNNKVENLKAIAKELNIGLDSLVFIDDSTFEVNLVKEMLPEVLTIEVPRDTYLYPAEFRKYTDYFYSKNVSSEDLKRLRMYKENFERINQEKDFVSIVDYLKALKLGMVIYANSYDKILRMAQLTQKTNQFNLTTKRYTETQIKEFVESKRYEILAFEIKDKFGEFGITGLSIVEIKNELAIIDTLLMSCRILGRNIEIKFMSELIKYLQIKGITKIEATYDKTLKNEQVANFYDKVGFNVKQKNQDRTEYVLSITDNYQTIELDYINVNYGK